MDSQAEGFPAPCSGRSQPRGAGHRALSVCSQHVQLCACGKSPTFTLHLATLHDLHLSLSVLTIQAQLDHGLFGVFDVYITVIFAALQQSSIVTLTKVVAAAMAAAAEAADRGSSCSCQLGPGS